MTRTILVITGLIVMGGCGDDDTIMVDAGNDAAFDSGPRCMDDAECDDGLFCTGEESCAEGICRPGDVIVCDDGIECTIDACNEITDRCEGLAPDLDEDGAGDMSCVDAGGDPLGRDCDDNDAGRFGGNLEICDAEGVDEDCDAATFGTTDNDGDGFIDRECRNTNAGGMLNRGDDCDDGREDVNPSTTEVCDHVDNNCDGMIDEGVLVQVALDGDRDGFPSNDTMDECPGFAGLVAIDDSTLFDCDDEDLTRNPGQVEICDGQDNDCDDAVDENAVAVQWFLDNDGDGFGSSDSGMELSCTPVVGASLLNTDCDDNNPARHPAAAERCNALDDDCNGRADYPIADGDFEDDDGDGSPDASCGLPEGVDCDDRDPSTAGSGVETCDGRDNDCDGRVDEDVEVRRWFYDGDGDGDGTLSNAMNPPLVTCSPPPHYVTNSLDCDDNNGARNTHAVETCGGVDDDCDGEIDEGIPACECADGFMSCTDRCETNIWNDTNNCGGCGLVCGGLNEDVAFCNAGDCVLIGCSDGFGDCTAGPGCETSLDSDEHCGRCDLSCVDGATCTAEFCAAPDENSEALCSDETDNDMDGMLDCEDPGCAEFETCLGLAFAFGTAGAIDHMHIATEGNNVYVSATFQGHLEIQDEVFEASGTETVIFSRNSDGPRWTSSLHSSGLTTQRATVHRVVMGQNNDVYVVGEATGMPSGELILRQADAISHLVGNIGAKTGFVVRLDRNNGRYLGGTTFFSDGQSVVHGLAFTVASDPPTVVVTGEFNGTLSNPAGADYNATSQDFFVAELNAASLAPIAAYAYGSTAADFAYDIAVHPLGHYLVVGAHGAPVIIGETTIPHTGGPGAFYLALNPVGDYMASLAASSTGSASFVEIEVQGSEIFITGRFENEMNIPSAEVNLNSTRGIMALRLSNPFDVMPVWISGSLDGNLVLDAGAPFIVDGSQLDLSFATNPGGFFADYEFPTAGPHVLRLNTGTGALIPGESRTLDSALNLVPHDIAVLSSGVHVMVGTFQGTVTLDGRTFTSAERAYAVLTY